LIFIPEQNKSLQKLNQELSTRLNEQRVEIQKLKSDLDKSLIESKNQIKFLKQNQQLTAKSADGKTQDETLKFSNDVLTKIETLICEIQSGFDSNERS